MRNLSTSTWSVVQVQVKPTHYPKPSGYDPFAVLVGSGMETRLGRVVLRGCHLFVLGRRASPEDGRGYSVGEDALGWIVHHPDGSRADRYAVLLAGGREHPED